MSALTWVVVGIVAYWLVATTLARQGWLPSSVSVSGPMTTISTERGKGFLDSMARWKRFWRAWANVGVGVAIVVMVVSFAFLLMAAILAVRNPQPTQVTQPRNVLVIPGVNDFLPLEVAPEIVIGLLVGLVVHEGGHGLLCRVEGIEIRKMGLALFTFIPLGAFVEPDPESQAAADRGGRTRMFAAGVTNNFVITIIAFGLLFGPIAGAIAVAPGAAVGDSMPNSAAEEAGIGAGDRITAIDGQEIADNEEAAAVLEDHDGNGFTAEIDGERTVEVERSILVRAAPAGGGLDVDIEDRIIAVEGDPVTTVEEFRELVGERETATVTVQSPDGDQHETTIPLGALVTVTPDGALDEAGASANSELVVLSVDGERTMDREGLQAALDDKAPGDEVTVRAYVEGEPREFTATLKGDGEQGTLGVLIGEGITGLALDDVGVEYYPADRYLALLGGDTDAGLNPAITDSFIAKSMFAILLPIVGIIGMEELPFNFAGFTAEVTNFYVVDSALGGGVFIAANLLFWIAWLNINLGFFNCIPAFPLDGGHILRTSTEAIVSRLPVEGSYALTKVVTITVGLTMLLSLLMMIFGSRLLA